MLTIGRLAKLTGIEAKTLRYYDRVGLVPPAGRTAAKYRLYSEDAVARLRFIRRAKGLGISLADIRRILAVRDEGMAPCEHVLALVAGNLKAVEAQIVQLKDLRDDLRRLNLELKRRVPATPQKAEDCPCFEIIQAFRKPTTGARARHDIRSKQRGH